MENKYQMLIDASYSGWPYLTINAPSFAFAVLHVLNILSGLKSEKKVIFFLNFLEWSGFELQVKSKEKGDGYLKILQRKIGGIWFCEEIFEKNF